MWVLGTEPGISARVTSAHNHQAISVALSGGFIIEKIYQWSTEAHRTKWLPFKFTLNLRILYDFAFTQIRHSLEQRVWWNT